MWSVAVVAGVLGALVASGVGMVVGAFDRRTNVVSYPVIRTTPAVTAVNAQPPDWYAISQSLAPSIVSINVSAPSGPLQGSGVLYSGAQGHSYVLTDGALLDQGGSIQVVFADGASVGGNKVAIDPVTGLALIWVVGDDQRFPVLGSAADLRPPQGVLTLGEPPGAYPGQVISVDQQVVSTQGQTYDGVIAFTTQGMPAEDAGGALVDQNGEVVGINVGLSPADPSQQQLSFAVPIDTAMRVATQLMHGQQPTHPWIGVSDDRDVSTVTPQPGFSGGAQVGAVAPKSPASLAGIAASDVVTAFDGQPVGNSGTLAHLLAGRSPGDVTTITYLHQGKSVTATIKIVNEPASFASNGS